MANKSHPIKKNYNSKTYKTTPLPPPPLTYNIKPMPAYDHSESDKKYFIQVGDDTVHKTPPTPKGPINVAPDGSYFYTY